MKDKRNGPPFYHTNSRGAVLPHFLLQIQGSPVAGAQDGAFASSTMGAHSVPCVCISPLNDEPARASGAHQRCGARAGRKPVAVAWARRVGAGCVLFACAGASSLVSAAAGLPQPTARSLPRPPLAVHTGRPSWAGLERIKTLRLRGGQDKLTRTASVYQEEDDADAEVGNSDGDSDVSIELTSILGFGSFSTVYAGETRTGESLAVKRVQLQNADDVARRRLKREIRILSAMDHPNIVQLHRVIEDADCVSLVQEQCTGGELFDFVNDFQTFHANGERSWRRTNTTEMLTITEEHIAKMVRQILLAVDYMHSCNVVHRDLKLENVMLTVPFSVNSDPMIKIVDLGFSREWTGDNDMFTACGSTLYLAPEVLTAKATGRGYGRECDLWAVGVMTYILLCCRPPFSGATSADVGRAIHKGAYTYPDYALVSEEARELIRGLLEVDPAKRLTAKEALKSKWIASVEPPDSTQVPQVPCKGVHEAPPSMRQGRSRSLTSWLRSLVNTLALGGSDLTNTNHAAHIPSVALPV
jgi:serine/threonine protein kinase